MTHEECRSGGILQTADSIRQRMRDTDDTSVLTEDELMVVVFGIFQPETVTYAPFLSSDALESPWPCPLTSVGAILLLFG